MNEVVRDAYIKALKLRDELLEISNVTGLRFSLTVLDGTGWVEATKIDGEIGEDDTKMLYREFRNIRFDFDTVTNGATMFRVINEKGFTEELAEFDLERLS